MNWLFAYAAVALVVFGFAAYKWPHKVSPQEAMIGSAMYLMIMGAVYFTGTYTEGRDTAILNGQVTAKERETVSCSHSYRCRCYTTCSGGKHRSCSTHCSTCYEHSHDYDWVVKSTVGSVDIDRVDRQGVEEPKRWTDAVVGEPFAKETSYYNYIKAAPFSIFNRTQLESKVPVPGYISVYDYYRINRVIDFGAGVGNTSVLNARLNDYLRSLGPAKKANVVVIFHNKGPNFAETAKAKMLGGKFNDLTVLIETDKSGTIKGVNVFSWSKSDMVNISTRDQILDIGKVDQVKIADAIAYNIGKYFTYRSAKEFEYLDDETYISDTLFTLLVVLGILLPLVGVVVAYKVDSGTEQHNWRK